MYSTDFKNACIRLYHQLNSLRKVAQLIGSSPSSISRWFKQQSLPLKIKKIRKSSVPN